MYPQNDKIGVLEVLEVKAFFTAQPCWIFVKYSLLILRWWHLCKVIKKNKKFSEGK